MIAETPDGWWAAPGVSRPGRVLDLPAAVDALCRDYRNGADTAPLSGQLVGLRNLIDQLESVFLTAAADFAADGGPADHGAVNLAGWLRATCRFAPTEASARARVAAALDTELAGTAAALAGGDLSWRHAEVILATARQAAPEHRAAVEEALQQPAKQLDPQQLKRLGQAVLHRLDADDADRRALQRLDRRGVSLAETLDGMVAIHGLLDPMAGATIKAAIEAITLPSRTNTEDDRSWPQRRADALSDICHHFLDSGTASTTGGIRPHLSVLVDLQVLQRQPGAGVVDLPGVGTLTAGQARQLACDAAISRIITNGPSSILDVGRTTRTVPAGLRRAVIARDRTCVGIGCEAPPSLCEAHHIQFWDDGGPTTLDNLALLCRRHHTLVHLAGHPIKTRPDGTKFLLPRVPTPPRRLRQ